MKVKQLIEQLELFDPDTNVFFETSFKNQTVACDDVVCKSFIHKSEINSKFVKCTCEKDKECGIEYIEICVLTD